MHISVGTTYSPSRIRMKSPIVVAHQLEGVASFDQGLPFCRQSLQQNRRYLAAVLLSLRALSDKFGRSSRTMGRLARGSLSVPLQLQNSDTANLGSAVIGDGR